MEAVGEKGGFAEAGLKKQITVDMSSPVVGGNQKVKVKVKMEKLDVWLRCNNFPRANSTALKNPPLCVSKILESIIHNVGCRTALASPRKYI